MTMYINVYFASAGSATLLLVSWGYGEQIVIDSRGIEYDPFFRLLQHKMVLSFKTC